MIIGRYDSSKSIKKRKLVNIEFNHHDLVPFDYQGIEPLIIIRAMGRTPIRRIYVDNGSSVSKFPHNKGVFSLQYVSMKNGPMEFAYGPVYSAWITRVPF